MFAILATWSSNLLARTGDVGIAIYNVATALIGK